jgi:Coenzyme PQQ synthesis protein D (PqqD)
MPRLIQTMSVSFTDRIRVPKDVLISRLQEESVLLNLDNESYYGLDDVGTRMLSVLNSSDSVQSAWLQLVDEYDVDREVLRDDLVSLVERLLEQGLVEVSPA